MAIQKKAFIFTRKREKFIQYKGHDQDKKKL